MIFGLGGVGGKDAGDGGWGFMGADAAVIIMVVNIGLVFGS